MSTEEGRMEPVNTPAAEPSSAGTDAAKQNEISLADELREFGKQIEGLFKTARSSTRGKEIETQLTAAWRDVEKGVNDAITKAQAADVKGTVTGTTKYAADEAQTGLARGLKGLNVWLASKRTGIEDRRKADEAAKASGTADDEVTDRFGEEGIVFGQGYHVPETPPLTGVAPAGNQDDLVSDRFGDNPPKL